MQSRYGEGPNSLKLDDHWKQTSEANRFQEYVENWANPGNTEGALYELDGIKNLPVSMYVAENDMICEAAVAQKESEKIQTLQNYYLLLDADHGFPASNRPDFVDLLRKEVTTKPSSTPNRQEIRLDLFEESDSQKNNGKMAKLWEFMAQMTFLSIANSLATYSAL